MGQQSELSPGVRRPRILYLQYVNPAAYPPLEHSSTILADRGWDVLFLGIGALGAASLKLAAHPRIRHKQFGGAPRGWRQKVHFLGFIAWVWWHTVTWRPNVIYASDLLSNPVTWLVGWWTRAPIVYHEHDSPSRSETTRLESVWRWFRIRLARRADFYVLPNADRLEEYRRECRPAGMGFCVWNCPLVREVGPSRQDEPLAGIRVVYHGSVNSERLPFSILDALATLPANVELQVAGYTTIGWMDYFDRLRNHARDLGIGERLTILGPIPEREDLLSHCRKCDLGLAFMPKGSSDINMTHMTGASNKPFDYLANGLALMVSDLADWRSLFVDGGFGLACDPKDATSVANAIRWCVEHPQEVRAMGERGRLRIQSDWNYEKQFEPLLRELTRAAGLPRIEDGSTNLASAA